MRKICPTLIHLSAVFYLSIKILFCHSKDRLSPRYGCNSIPRLSRQSDHRQQDTRNIIFDGNPSNSVFIQILAANNTSFFSATLLFISKHSKKSKINSTNWSHTLSTSSCNMTNNKLLFPDSFFHPQSISHVPRICALADHNFLSARHYIFHESIIYLLKHWRRGQLC